MGPGDAGDLLVSILVGHHEGRAEETPGAERGDDAGELHDAEDVAATKLLSIDERQKERVCLRRPGTAPGQHHDPFAQQGIARELGQRLVEVAEVVHGVVGRGVVAEIVGEESLVLPASPEIREAAAERRQDSDGGPARVACHPRVSA